MQWTAASWPSSWHASMPSETPTTKPAPLFLSQSWLLRYAHLCPLCRYASYLAPPVAVSMVAFELCLHLLLVTVCIMFGSAYGIVDGGIVVHNFHPLLYSALLDIVHHSKNSCNSNDNDSVVATMTVQVIIGIQHSAVQHSKVLRCHHASSLQGCSQQH